jgi:alpha/beta superfamily hydrolase
LARRIESLFISGPVGRLEALLEEPESADIREVALVCHLHPNYGGTMRNKVVYRLARGLRSTGSAVLRFNFRGVHLSDGEYDHGHGEVEDARAALEFLRGRYPELPFTLAGFSFGSRVALRLGCQFPDAARIIAVGFPTAYQDSQFLGQCQTPRYFIQSTHDEFGPREEFQPYFDQLKGRKRVMYVEAADHFFSDALDLFEKTVTRL